MWLAALSLGFISSLHCIGMCSPLAMLIQGATTRQLLVNRLLYNTGRVVTYSTFGLFMGLLGSVIHIGGYQNVLSISVGLIIIVISLFPKISAAWSAPVNAILLKIKKALARQLKVRQPASSFSAGMLNGILPCGLVYMALAFAVIQETVYSSVLFMALFGLGTIPALLAMVYGAHIILRYIPFSIKRLQSVFLIALAVIMIGRGIMHDAAVKKVADQDGVVQCF